MAKPGRKLKLDADREKKLIDALAAGNYRKQACMFAGIHEATLYRWLDQGLTDQQADTITEFSEFREKVMQAESAAEIAAVTYMRKAMPNDWRAAEAYLRSKHPERWATHRDLTKIAERRLRLEERQAERIALAAEEALAVLKLDVQQRALFVQAFSTGLSRLEDAPPSIEGTAEEDAA